jgi:putative PIN family toxin of toxin-antitoxin system
MIRVVLDTNIIVSATILKKGHSAQVLDLWRKGKIEVALSPPILREIEEVLRRPRIVKQQWMREEEVATFIKQLRQSSILTPGLVEVTLIKADPEDNKFLACALEAKAKYIVSGDPHLKSLKTFQGIRILPPREFLKIMKSSQT